MRKSSATTNAQAVGWVMLGTALFSLVFASGKFAGESASALQILFLRYIGGLLTLSAVVVLRRESLIACRSSKRLSHFMRAVFGSAGGCALIYASASMPIVDATAIGLLYVVFVIPLGVLFLDERVTRQHLAGIALCCSGAALVMTSRGAFTQFSPAYIWPAAIAVLGAALLALEGVLIRVLSVAERPMTVLLHVNGFGIFLMALPAALTWKPLSPADALPFLLLGPIAVTAQYCIVRGYSLASLSLVGPVDYSWLVFAGLIGFLFFGEVPTRGVLLGSMIIAAGGVMLAIVKPGATERA